MRGTLAGVAHGGDLAAVGSPAVFVVGAVAGDLGDGRTPAPDPAGPGESRRLVGAPGWPQTSAPFRLVPCRPATAVDGDGGEGAPSHLEVPRPVRVAADWSWRLLVIAAAVLALLLLADRLKLLILALFVATLLTALLDPAVRWVQRVARGSRGFATTSSWCWRIAVLAALIAALAVQIGGSFSDLSDKFTDGLAQSNT